MRRFNFFYELKRNFALGENYFPCNQCVIMDFSSLYFEGVKSVLKLEDCEIDLMLSKYNVKITGHDLKTIELTDKTICVKGKIDGVNKF